MATWQDEPGAREWRQAVETADCAHGPGVPPGELPGYLQAVLRSTRWCDFWPTPPCPAR